MPTSCELPDQLPPDQSDAMRVAIENEVNRRLEEKVACQRRLLDLAQEGGRVGIFEIDMRSGASTGSAMWARLLGLPKGTGHLDRRTWIGMLHPDDRTQILTRVEAAFQHGGDTAIEYRIVLPDGSHRWLHSRNLIEKDDAGGSYRAYGTLQDITDRKLLEAEILHSANHDSLTDLPNRRRFMEELSNAFERQSEENPVGVVLFDLDDLKPTNDSHGHHAGDALIVAAARRLRNVARHSGMAARIGGDEFALLLTGSNALRRRALAERTLSIFQRRVRFDGAVLRSGASAGGALQTAVDGRSPEHLLRRADTALYVAKRTSRGRYREAGPDCAPDS